MLLLLAQPCTCAADTPIECPNNISQTTSTQPDPKALKGRVQAQMMCLTCAYEPTYAATATIQQPSHQAGHAFLPRTCTAELPHSYTSTNQHTQSLSRRTTNPICQPPLCPCSSGPGHQEMTPGKQSCSRATSATNFAPSATSSTSLNSHSCSSLQEC